VWTYAVARCAVKDCQLVGVLTADEVDDGCDRTQYDLHVYILRKMLLVYLSCSEYVITTLLSSFGFGYGFGQN